MSNTTPLPASGQPTDAGIRFGPTAKQKFYISMNKHRGSGDRVHKNMWLVPDVKPQDEYAIFERADDTDSHCAETNHYWGFGSKSGAIIGFRNERLAKYPVPTNASDDWHGYPVTNDEKRPNHGLPGDALVERWISANLIDKEFGLKILRGAV